jgi:uncharacterized membrane protein YbhN (UPF0104 family)
MLIVTALRRTSATSLIRRARWIAIPTLALVALIVAPAFDIPRPPLAGCAAWIAIAGGFEVLSVLGFILVFKLIFGKGMSGRQVVVSGLRALGASSLLPGGVVVGPALGARAGGQEHESFSALTRSTVAFTVIVLLPGAIVVGVLGAALWLGLLPGPHDGWRTLPAVGFTLVVVVVVVLRGRPPARHSRRPGKGARGPAFMGQIAAALRAACDGIPTARSTMRTRDWKLVGTLGYYAFDNAALWAAFHAYGAAPEPTVIVMGYLVGSLGAAVPVPAGLGVVEGGLIGALVLYGAPAGPAAGAVLLYRAVSLALPVGLGAPAWAVLPAARLRRRLAAVSAPQAIRARLRARTAQ